MKNQIQKMPKIVLHLHLDGSLRPETAKEWVDEIRNQETELEKVQKLLMVEKDCRDLNEYLEKFDLPVKLLQSKEHIERATYELYEDLSKQNVKYAEVRFAPSKHLLGGLSYDEVIQAAIDGLNKAKEEFDIDGSLILCCMRGDDNKEENINTINAAKTFLGKGVSAVDLAGGEALFKTENFEDIFEEAKKKGIPFTIHAGEADGPQSMRAALRFGAKRIGHGVRCLEDEELVKELIDKKIPLEVCPISNLQTQAVSGTHPIGELVKKGLAVTISPDNNTVSNTNIIEEYEYVLGNTGLTIGDLISMNITAAENIFGTPEQKKRLADRIISYKNKEDVER